jgi:hypothetical protein
MKRPAFQFYPADWRKDSALQSCSGMARGLWIEMMCVMHECEPYGHMSINGNALAEAQAARMVGFAVSEYRKALAELGAAGVFSRSASGVIYCRRMVKDESIRNLRADAGRLGGNPNLVNQNPKQTDGQKDKQTHKQILTPSSASSASSASSSKSDVGVTPTVDAHAQGNGKNGADKDKNTAKTKHNSHWSASAEGLAATAQTLGITRHSNEDDAAWKDRVFATVNAKMVQGAARARRGNEPESREH